MVRLAALLLALLPACTTVPRADPGGTESFASGVRSGQIRVPVFLPWYENCNERGCDVDRAQALERLTECLSEGARRSHPELVLIPGGRIDEAQPSALIEDPRAHGHPDERVSAAVRDSAARHGAKKYAVLLEVITRRDGHYTRSAELSPASPVLVAGVGGTNRFTQRTRIDAVIVDLTTQRWVARARRGYSGSGQESSGLVFIFPFPIAIPRFASVSTETERASCTATGDAIGELFKHQT